MSRAEDGFTMVELLVTTLLVAIVGTFALGFLVNTTTATAIATSSAEAEKQAQLILRTISQDVRGSQNIRATYPSTTTCPTGGSYPSSFGDCIRFDVVHTSLTSQNCPRSMITYGVANGVLRQDTVRYAGSGCAATSTTTGKVLAQNMVATTPLFTFFELDGSPLDATDDIEEFQNASAVKVTVSIRHRRGSPPVTVSTTLALRNNR